MVRWLRFSPVVASLSALACVGDAPASGSSASSSGMASSSSSGMTSSSSSGSSASSSSGGSDASAGFTPTDLGSSLVAWFDASRLVTADAGNLVSAWGDASGTGNAAAAMGTARPARTANALAGHDVLTFNGSTTYLTVADSTSLQWGTSDWAVLVVARYANPVGGLGANATAAFWHKNDTAIPAHGVQFNGNTLSAGFLDTCVARSAGNTLTGTTARNDNVFRVYAARRNSDRLELRVNGAQEAISPATSSISAENVSQAGIPVSIGGANNGSSLTSMLAGDIAEIVAVRGPLSDNNLGKVETYLRSRYSL